MSEALIEQAIAEYLTRAESGDPPDRTTFLARFPSISAELQEFLDDHEKWNTTCQLEGKSKLDWPIIGTPPDSGGPSSSSWQSGSGQEFRRFGDYEILEEINHGGMGVVYRARDSKLNRIVALKMIRSGELASPQEVERFYAETNAAAALQHPNIVPVYDVGQCSGLHYFTMGFIEGSNLAQLSQDKIFSPRDAARIVARVADAIDFAHRAGVVHRDIKPANIMLDHQGEPYITDFGLAKSLRNEQDLTATGQILGTPAYMPPEQAVGRRHVTTFAGDVYSLGAVLYALCTGQAPFSGPTPFDIILQVIDRDPPRMKQLNRGVPVMLDRICRRAMEKEPHKRYATAKELSDDLIRFLKGEPIETTETSWLDRLEAWWRREPILICHLCGVGAVATIVTLTFCLQNTDVASYLMRVMLLAVWLLTAVILQKWVAIAKYRDTACLTWATVDVIIYTLLIYMAHPPRGLLLVGYPMLIAASALFFRTRFVIFMTIACSLGFIFLVAAVDDPDFVKWDFCAIFLSGLAVLGLVMHSTIRRIRTLNQYFEESRV